MKAKPWSNVSIVTLRVRDFAASRRFWADGLDWKPVYENKEIVFFQAGGMILTLFLRDELAQDENGMTPAFTMTKRDLNVGRSRPP